MPIIVFILIAVLVAQVGFWDTFGAILGAFGVIALFLLLLAATLALVGYMLFRRVRS